MKGDGTMKRLMLGLVVALCVVMAASLAFAQYHHGGSGNEAEAQSSVVMFQTYMGNGEVEVEIEAPGRHSNLGGVLGQVLGRDGVEIEATNTTDSSVPVQALVGGSSAEVQTSSRSRGGSASASAGSGGSMTMGSFFLGYTTMEGGSHARASLGGRGR
jgi:hypothetical protein